MVTVDIAGTYVITISQFVAVVVESATTRVGHSI